MVNFMLCTSFNTTKKSFHFVENHTEILLCTYQDDYYQKFKIKKISIAKDVEKLEPSYCAGRN